MKRMIMILAALVAVNVYADYIPKDYRKTEVTDTIRPRTIKQVQASSWQLYWSFEQDGVDIPLTNATSVYLKINDDDQTWTTTITGSVDSVTNAFVQVNPADLNTNGEFEFTLTAENSTSVLAYAYGELILQAMAGSGITNPLVATTNINWADYVYTGTEVSGPVRPDGVTISATANADGSIIITTTGSATNTTVVMPGTMIDVTTNMQNYTVTHADTSALSSIDNSGQNVLIDLDVDSRGHVTNAASTNLALVFNTIASVDAKVIAVSNIMNTVSNDLSAEITTATNDIYGDALSAANTYTDSATNDIIGDASVLAYAADTGVSNAFISADTIVSNGVTSAFIAADTVVSNISLQNVVEDTSPTLGGNLDADSKDLNNIGANNADIADVGTGTSFSTPAGGATLLGADDNAGALLGVYSHTAAADGGSILLKLGTNTTAELKLLDDTGVTNLFSVSDSGDGTLAGDLTVSGTVKGTSTNATYLGNVIAADYATDAEVTIEIDLARTNNTAVGFITNGVQMLVGKLNGTNGVYWNQNGTNNWLLW